MYAKAREARLLYMMVFQYLCKFWKRIRNEKTKITPTNSPVYAEAEGICLNATSKCFDWEQYVISDAGNSNTYSVDV